MDRNKAIDSLNEIKELMERSTKFVSLSGSTGILVGIYALVGAWFTYNTLQAGTRLETVVAIALLVLALSLLTAFAVYYLKVRNSGQKLFNKMFFRVMWNFSVPLLTGGLFCLALLIHGYYGLTSSVMLLFYGLTLVHISKYTFSNVCWLGYAFLLLGLFDCFFEGNGLLCWAIGFGLFHIIYGVLFYFLYEKRK